MLHAVTCQNYKLLIAARSNMPELQITNLLHAVTCQNYKLLIATRGNMPELQITNCYMQ